MGTTDTKIFDRETLLDLTVNFIPLGILLFFTVYVLVVDPWSMGDDPLMMVLTLGLHVVPFVALAFLTYLSGKAIAGSEKESEVYLAGRATVTGAQPLETEHHGEESDHAEIGEPNEAATAAAEGDADAAEEAADGESDDETGTPDKPGAEGETGTEGEIETGTADEAETKDATEGVSSAEDDEREK